MDPSKISKLNQTRARVKQVNDNKIIKKYKIRETSGVKVRPTLISPQYSPSLTTLYAVGGRLPSMNSGSKGMLQGDEAKLLLFFCK